MSVLADERLHEFIGGEPSGLVALRDRYERLVAGSPNADEVWLNWTVRRREDARAIGTMQATLTASFGRRIAYVAWVVGVDWQGRGYAAEAARALVDWLGTEGMDEVRAHIHPDHHASAAVAARALLEPTDDVVDSERVWRRRFEPSGVT